MSTPHHHLRLAPPPKPKRATRRKGYSPDWLPPTARRRTISVPSEVREGDPVINVTACDDKLEHENIREGDDVPCFVTDDVRPGEVALFTGGGQCWLGVYRPGPGGYMKMDVGKSTTTFKPGEAELRGRALCVVRRERLVRRFRPIR